MVDDRKLRRVLAGEAVWPPPVWLMRQAGRYLPEYRATRAQARDFLDLCYRPDLAAEVTLQPLRRYAFDAAIVFADILLVPQALGQPLKFVEGEGPRLAAIGERDSVLRLDREGAGARLASVGETIAKVRAQLPRSVSLIGFAGSPWTVATYMAQGQGSDDQRAARLWAYRDPEGLQVLIDLLCDVTVEYLAMQVRAGADVVQLFDSWASMLPHAEFERWVVAPTARIVRDFKLQCPDVPVIGFARGARDLERYAMATGVACAGLDIGVPLGYARQRLQPHAAVQGNLDPLVLVTGGEALLRAVDAIVEGLRGGPHIFNLGHGIVPETPPEHVGLLVDRVAGAL
ncbi:MAG TPA: uroporphyrinogen decarboxylase [Alphaproteobacteria bacterium]|nr:uroporphyrinogen decarboxylase [Alphaproteobacteria bacterium]